METLLSLLGIGILFGLGILLSSNRDQINWRTAGLALLLQFMLGGIALYFPIGVAVLEAVSNAVSSVLNNAQDGIDFVFGNIGAFEMGFIFAFHVLPVIVFFSSLVSVLYHVGIMGWLIRTIGGALQRLLRTSKAESMSATANIFVGMTEAPLIVRPYIANMTAVRAVCHHGRWDGHSGGLGAGRLCATRRRNTVSASCQFHGRAGWISDGKATTSRGGENSE